MTARPSSDATLLASSPFGEAEAARWFFENALDLFAVVTPEGRFSVVNPAWTALTGWSADDLIGQACVSFVHPESHAELVETGRRIRQTGSAVNRLRVLRKDGGTIWLEGHSRRGPGDEMVGVLHDISAKVAASRTHEMLAEAAGIGVWSYDPRSGAIEWSPDALIAAGLSPADLATVELFLSHLPDDQRDAVFQTFANAVTSGQPGTV